MRYFTTSSATPIRFLIVLLPLLALALAACSPPDSGDSPGETQEGGAGNGEGAGEVHIVHLANFEFDTEELTIAAGDIVRFVNDDDAPHTATHGENGTAADDAAFDIDLAAAGEDAAEGETDPLDAGTYTVTCEVHPDMNMTIIVEG